MESGNMTVAVQDLCRAFGDFVAVDHVNLQVAKGEIFGFLGPNGSGKSTTIRMLCGLLLPTSGRGMVGGYDILTQPEQIKRNIGYMSQKFSLYDDLTVEENIDFFGGVYNVSASKFKERKEWTLTLAGLQDRRKTITQTLAGGLKQRLALGCAILHEPPIIFLDEPTSGVDPLSRRNFWALIHDMATQGITVFVTTHYMDEADYCDRLGLIYRGKLIAEGTPNELKHTLMQRDVVEIAVEPLMPALGVLQQQGLEAAMFGSAVHVTVADAAAQIPQIQAQLQAAGLTVTRIEQIVPSLEDVFVTLIEEA